VTRLTGRVHDNFTKSGRVHDNFIKSDQVNLPGS
jgi:hypothetical protein